LPIVFPDQHKDVDPINLQYLGELSFSTIVTFRQIVEETNNYNIQ
jgi:hypothetical protein